ncbi:hypothetical protein [Aliiglaciecola sp. M165]|uniref:hypothetical protein n=1 Tax=Aliiglaciecola sp. M165 TaxID=2593649 RepID=UPI00117E72A5|nr:hypothetical protein [Aliiglaciecola sp. M165]TRY29804.1 hypothetical protein FM019_16670 [Aliiglaciecola sp. M165]
MRTLLRIFSFSTITLMTLAGTAVANECVELTRAMKDVQLNVRTSDFRQFVFSNYCEANGSIKASTSSAQVEAVIKEIPATFTGTSGSNSQKMQRFCSNYAVDAEEYTYTNTSYERLADNAYEAIKACYAFNNNNAFISHAMQTLRKATFTLVAGNSPIEITGISITPKDSATCKGQLPDAEAGKSVPLNEDSKISVDKTFNFVCERSPTATDDNGDTFTEAEITVLNNIQPYNVIMPADFQFNADRASEIAGLLQTMQKKMDAELTAANTAIALLEKTTLQTGKFVLPRDAKCNREFEVKFGTAFATTPNLFFGTKHAKAVGGGVAPYVAPQVKVKSKSKTGFKFNYCGIQAHGGKDGNAARLGVTYKLEKHDSMFDWVAVAIEN